MTDHADQYRVLIGELDDAVNTAIPQPPPLVSRPAGPRMDWAALCFVAIVVLLLVLYLQHG